MDTASAKRTGASATSVRYWSDARREAWAQDLLDQLTPAMSALGVLFLLVVLGEQFARPGSAVSLLLTVVGWLLWAVFAAEFVARMVVAPSTSHFLRRNWWQVLFLVLPFLRVLRLVRAIRVLRTGRVLSSTVRSSRSVHQVLGGRVAWLAVVTAITILGSSQLLYGFGTYRSYGAALHATALAAITGEPLGQPDPFAQVLEVLLAIFSVVVFATLAGTLGAYFLHSPGGQGGGSTTNQHAGPSADQSTGSAAGLGSGSSAGPSGPG